MVDHFPAPAEKYRCPAPPRSFPRDNFASATQYPGRAMNHSPRPISFLANDSRNFVVLRLDEWLDVRIDRSSRLSLAVIARIHWTSPLARILPCRLVSHSASECIHFGARRRLVPAYRSCTRPYPRRFCRALFGPCKYLASGSTALRCRTIVVFRDACQRIAKATFFAFRYPAIKFFVFFFFFFGRAAHHRCRKCLFKFTFERSSVGDRVLSS